MSGDEPLYIQQISGFPGLAIGGQDAGLVLFQQAVLILNCIEKADLVARKNLDETRVNRPL